jgi:NAD(P)-dependent dehydrogenase (short-subunit alcohol dehydrogenase family)
MVLTHLTKRSATQFASTTTIIKSPLVGQIHRQTFLQAAKMPGKYSKAHKTENLAGPGDVRPTALQIITDEGLSDQLSDKVFIVTGASSGLGIETGRALAATGAKVYLTARNIPKAQSACSSFLSPGRVELLHMDNASLSSVRAAAASFRRKEKTLNVLVNNAGIMACPEFKTEDGFEAQFGVCHLAHFLFFMLLKDVLLASSTASFHSRVVNVSSSGHAAGEVQFGNYGFEAGNYSPWAGYGQAKTANIYMANEIENLYGAKGLHGLSLMPGGIVTGLQKHMPAEQIEKFKNDPAVLAYLKSTEQGAATTVLAAVGKEYEGRGRLYLCDCETATEGMVGQNGYVAYAFDREKEGRLWEDSLEMVGLGRG